MDNELIEVEPFIAADYESRDWAAIAGESGDRLPCIYIPGPLMRTCTFEPSTFTT